MGIIWHKTGYSCKKLLNILAGTSLLLAVGIMPGYSQLDSSLVVKGHLHLNEGAQLFIQGDLSIATQTGQLTHGGTIDIEGNLAKDQQSSFDALSTSLVVFRNDEVNTTKVQYISGDFTGDNAIEQLQIDNRASDPALHLASGNIEIRESLNFTSGSLVTAPPPGNFFTESVHEVFVSNNEPGVIEGDLNNYYIKGKLRRSVRNNRTYFIPVGPLNSSLGVQPFELTYYVGPPTDLDIEFTEGGITPIGTTATCDVGTPPNNFGTPDGILDELSIDCVTGKWQVESPVNNALYDINFFPGQDLLDQCDFVFHWMSKDGQLLSDCPVNGYEVLSQNSFSFFDIPGVNDPNVNIVLPVELADFTAIGLSDLIELRWATLSEVNSDGFEIQRSSDGENFERIGWAQAQGHSQIPVSYQFHDINVQKNKEYYYRLKMVDLDGQFEFSEVETAMLEGSDNFREARVYPNPISPANQNLNFVALANGEMTISLYNSTGQMVFEQTMDVTEGFNDVDLPKLATGPYHMILKDEVYTRRSTVVVAN